MFWTLVFIAIVNGEARVETIGTFDGIRECFFAREDFAANLGSYDGYFPKNMQAVCILSE